MVHLICLLSCEHHLDWIGHHASNHASGQTSHDLVIRPCRSSWIRIDPVKEIQKGPNSCSCVGHSSDNKSIKRCIETTDATTCVVDFFVDLTWMNTTLESDACVDLAFLEHLGTNFYQVKRLGLLV